MKRLIFALAALASVTMTYAGVQTLEKKVPAGKALVERLPRQAEGVTLDKNVVKLKPGYKFVRQEDGTVKVARARGGAGSLGVGGKWSCHCNAAGGGSGCSVITSGQGLYCDTKGCKESCVLTVTINGLANGVVGY